MNNRLEDVESDKDSVHEYENWSLDRLKKLGVESRGIQPVPLVDRVDNQSYKIFFLWFTANFNILSFSAGTLGPIGFGLGLRDSCLVILFFNMLCCLPPAYLSTWGPKLGLRQMVQARYSFGYFGVIIPCLFNLIVMLGFSTLNSILGGQTLASVTDNRLSWTVGIVIITVISLLVSFCGYRVLNWYERIAWIPVFVTFIVTLGLGGKYLNDFESPEPASASTILTFASTIAGFVITYSSLASDFTIYYDPRISSVKIFILTYLGFLVAIIPLQCLGAVVGGAISQVPSWSNGYGDGNIGGLLEAMLQPVGGFGKFLTVLLALSVAGNITATFYSIGLNCQIVLPILVDVPRYVFSIVASAIVLPLAIVGSHRFYDTLTDFLGLISYWAGAYVAIVVCEHLVFRRGRFHAYDLDDWNHPRRLPWGLAALGAGICSAGLVVPSMDQVWFTGPIAVHTGDIGFELAFAISALFYLPFRWAERRWHGF